MGRVTVVGGKVGMEAPVTGILLSTIAEGSIVKLNENGSPVEFYVAKHDYESTLNGTGRTLLVRKDCYDKREFSTGRSRFTTSTIYTWLNGAYKGMLDSEVQDAMGSTTYYYTYPYKTIDTNSSAVFLLSIAEFGLSSAYAMTEGSALPTADLLKVAYFEGTAVEQYTRTLYKDDWTFVFYISEKGKAYDQSTEVLRYSRPCFTLPSTSLFDEDTLVFKGVA